MWVIIQTNYNGQGMVMSTVVLNITPTADRAEELVREHAGQASGEVTHFPHFSQVKFGAGYRSTYAHEYREVTK